MARTRLVETTWGQPDRGAPPDVAPIKSENVPIPPGDFGDLVARADELIGTMFILELEDNYPPLRETALIANWVRDTGELAGYVAGTPQLVFTTLDWLAAVAEAKTGAVVERPWRAARETA